MLHRGSGPEGLGFDRQKKGHENDSASFVDFLHPEYYLGFVTDEEIMAESQPLKAFIFEGVSEWVYIWVVDREAKREMMGWEHREGL